MTTRLLIDCGADVNAEDIDGNTPLHILVRNTSSSTVLKMIDLLSDAGAHLDYVNKRRRTPLGSTLPSGSKINDRLKKRMNVMRLKCLCAQIIQKQQVPYENLLTISLVNFVQKH